MRFTDIFINRPVLATVVSLLIFFFGLRAIGDLPLRQFPEVQNTVINVTTVYPGADAQLVQSFITTPITQALATAEGLDYVTAESTTGVSMVKVHVRLDYDADTAFTSVMSKVAEVRSILPQESEDPVIQKDTGANIALMYLSFVSDRMTSEQITDYLVRVVRPEIEATQGVSEADILGGKIFAMRIWLDPQKMASRSITADDVTRALQQNNFQSTAGTTKGEYTIRNVRASTDLSDVAGFENLIIRHQDEGGLIRLRDIAKVELGSQWYDSEVTFNGNTATFMSVSVTPEANPLTVIKDVRQLLPKISQNFPPSLESNVVYDATAYIDAAINEVYTTIVEATIIVIIIIFLFLGSIRTVAIPVIAIPLSLIGVMTFLFILGYSMNLLTLLALVLAIGIVVDDAIVVVENIHRHIEDGLSPYDAAIQGAREIAMPVISMTLTLVAVYLPIGFMGGLSGALFKEFAFTLAGAVVVSGVVALTLSPMLSAKFLNKQMLENKFAHRIDQYFNGLKERYQQRVHNSLNYRPVTLVFASIILISCFFLYTHTAKELAPQEDQSALFVSATGPQYANLNYMTAFSDQISTIFEGLPETRDYFIVKGMGAVNNVIGGLMIEPWEKRDRSQFQIQPDIQQQLSNIAGLNSVIFPIPSLPGGFGLPIEFVLTSTENFEILYQLTEQLLQRAQTSGRFIFLDTSLKFNRPEAQVIIDRSKAAELGINMQDIGSALATVLGDHYTNRFNMEGRSYQVIAQAARQFRATTDQISNIQIKTKQGIMVPLSTFVTIKQDVQPNKLSQFQQLNAITIQGMMMPGVTIGDALDYLQQEANTILPLSVSYDYAGQSRRFIQEGSTLVYTFFFALLVIYLVLAAQFESFRDPWIILVTVPMSIAGALIPLNLGLATINIYTQVGLVTLIGLISRHGILMVEFANKLQEQGVQLREAIEQASAIRLRPILMTTAATVMGVMPLVLASGAGAQSRFSMGLVIAAGMTIGTLFTLFVLPAIYTLIAKDRNK